MDRGSVAIVVHQDRPGGQPAAIASALRRRGVTPIPTSVRELAVEVEGSSSRVLHRGRSFAPAAVLTQGLNRSWSFCEQVLGLLEEQGVRVVNPTGASALALDKLAVAKVLSKAGVPVLALRAQAWGAAPAEPPAFRGPFVTKPSRGSNGAGILEHGSWPEASAHLGVDRELGPEGLVGVELVQPRATDAGADLRVMVVAGSVLGCARRRAREGIVAGWANAEVEAFEDGEAEATALAAVAQLGLAYAAVDLVQHEGAWQVIDVNCWPRDLEAMGTVVGADILGAVVDVLLANAPSASGW